ncbi:hypothetical protein KAR91_00315 [Candidatus Pacearchaeota archaeon]|nr:hypothetical protein [Candidatus Pacearchaeota archaeon]
MNHYGELYYNDYIRTAFFAVQYVAFLGLTYGVLRAAVTMIAKSFWWGIMAFFGALLISHIVYLFCPAEAEIVIRNGEAVRKVSIGAYGTMTSSKGYFGISAISVFVWISVYWYKKLVNYFRIKNYDTKSQRKIS